MREKENFTRSLTIDITVAMISINKEDWYCFKPGMSQKEIREVMVEKKYDIVPIYSKKGDFNSYFILNKQNSEHLDSKIIQPDDRLYYLTHVRDAVWKMKKEKRTHYFLSNGHDENDIVGLLSLSDFNSREFYVYLFSIISYIEKEFASLIEFNNDNGFKILESHCDSQGSKEQLKIIFDRYTHDQLNATENDYKEYLYLHHLICLIKSEKKFQLLDYKDSESFEKGTKLLRELRNEIAHPVRSIVRNLNDLENLEAGLNKLYEFKERLDNYLTNTKLRTISTGGNRVDGPTRVH